ncbi:hypothetical protein BDW22DRAFT_1420768 [Trametopsis cervina]|nr:hypothetical protein BDW22DRAFT_1420768 [Trametopsis cervina]
MGGETRGDRGRKERSGHGDSQLGRGGGDGAGTRSTRYGDGRRPLFPRWLGNRKAGVTTLSAFLMHPERGMEGSEAHLERSEGQQKALRAKTKTARRQGRFCWHVRTFDNVDARSSALAATKPSSPSVALALNAAASEGANVPRDMLRLGWPSSTHPRAGYTRRRAREDRGVGCNVHARTEPVWVTVRLDEPAHSSCRVDALVLGEAMRLKSISLSTWLDLRTDVIARAVPPRTSGNAARLSLRKRNLLDKWCQVFTYRSSNPDFESTQTIKRPKA